LRRRLDVAAKQNERSGLNAAKCSGCFRVEFGTGDAGHEKLAESRHAVRKEMSIAR
jgi:hypothetical protein